MRTIYLNEELRQLCDQQVRFAPKHRRLEQIEKAERLLGEIDPKKNYPYEYLCYRITDYRPGSDARLQVRGDVARHDLALLIEDLSGSTSIPAEAMGEPVMTVEELSQKFKVSSKTISRWRKQGLVGRRFVFDGRQRVGFLKSSVERFLLRNRDRVERGSKFSQLSNAEREEVVNSVRRLASAGGKPSEVIRRVAERVGRSVETVRYTVKAFDKEHPDMPLFPELTRSLSEQDKQRIYALSKDGKPVEQLAKKFHRTKTSIYRIINEVRASKILELPLEFMPSEEFRKPNAERLILSDMPTADTVVKKQRLPSGLPSYLASLYEVPLLNREQEAHMFRQYNYLKYRASKLRENLDPASAKASVMDEIERLNDEAVAVKNQIVRANLRLVVSIAKRHVGPADNFFDLVSDGNMSLIRAVEKFDYQRGNKFSTYATWAIMKNFARTIPTENRYRDRFRTSQEETLEFFEETGEGALVREAEQKMLEQQLGKILRRLDDREQKIIQSRYGLKGGENPRTLKEVGEELGVTKERVRQIEARALSKLREAAKEEHLEIAEE